MLNMEQKIEHLNKIAAKYGGMLRPEDVVNEAIDPEHPLHDCFEWNDTRAAHSHRVDQARVLIRSVIIETKTVKRDIETVFYVPDPDAPIRQGGYAALSSLQSDRERAHAAIAREFERALSALERANDISDALGIDSGVGSILVRIRELAARPSPLRSVG